MPHNSRSRSFPILVNLFLLVGVWTQVVQSVPYFLLANTRSKCMAVLTPQKHTVTIRYYAPDLQITDEEEESELLDVAKAEMTAEGNENKVGTEGMDSEWNNRLKEKLERMKSKKMRDMSITVSQSSAFGTGTGAVGTRSRRNRDYVSGRGRIREDLTKREGIIYFMTDDMDGKVDICVQSIIASAKGPARISLNVTMEPTEGTTGGPDDEINQGNTKEAGGDGLKHDEIKSQMGRFERDLSTLKSRVKHIISNADFNKEQAVDFHEQSVAMNRAATYWPMIQLFVIVIAGFTQANHIVHYMKTRHIV